MTGSLKQLKGPAQTDQIFNIQWFKLIVRAGDVAQY